MKQLYESEVLFQLMERDGFNIPSSVPPYEAEIKAYLINQVKQAYPKLTDYEAEWLLYNYTKHLPAEFPISTVKNTSYAHFENVVPFAYQSAILKGQTLVNLLNFDNVPSDYLFIQDITINQNVVYTIKGTLNLNNRYSTSNTPVLRIKVTNNDGNDLIFINGTGGAEKIIINQTIINTTSTVIHVRIFNQKPENSDFMIIEGDYTNVDIPYFEGMQSVKKPVLTTVGKNLFDGKMELGSITTKGIPEDSVDCLRSVNFIKIKPSTLYTITNDLGYTMALYEYDSDFNFIKNTAYNKAYTTLENTAYIKIKTSASKVETDLSVKFQIEEGYVGTSYEPFKSNILTVNEEVELRGIGDVKDELDLLTGELTQRIGKWVFNGTQSINKIEDSGDYVNIRFTVDGVKKGTGFLANNIYCDVLPVVNDLKSEYNQECIKLYGQGGYMEIRLTLSKTKVSTNAKSVNTYLQSNPITVQYRLATESVKTVDLTTLNESGETVHFMPLEGIMNVSTSSETIQPTFDMAVPVEATTQNLASFIDMEMEE